VGLDTGVDWIRVSGGDVDSDTPCAVVGGAVHCWGNNGEGQVGDGDSEPVLTPFAVTLTGPAFMTAGGFEHTCAALESGGIECWGRGHRGQLGDGSVDNSQTPVAVVSAWE
jgi:hypothetical protein